MTSIKDQIAIAVCESCEENPYHNGDTRGNNYRWQDYLVCAEAVIKVIESNGYKLVPIEPTPTMVTAALESSDMLNVYRVMACYDAMITAAPEAKP